MSKERRWYSSYPSNVQRTIEIPDKSLYTILEETVSDYSERAAIITDNNKVISYGRLKSSVDKLAYSFQNCGLKKGDRLGIMLPNIPEYFKVYYAAIKLGITIVQINPNYTVRELLQILQNSEVKHLVVQNENINKIEQLEGVYNLKQLFFTEVSEKSFNNRSHVISEMILNSEKLNYTERVDINEDVAVIQYTGGTTGIVKGVMLTHSNLVANVLQSYAVYGSEMKFGSEIVLTAIPLYHVYAMTSSMNLGIYIGATNLLLENYTVNKALETIKKYRPTYFPGVPRMYNDFIHHPEIESYGLNCLKFCSSGSAPLPVEIIKEFERITGASIAEGFGLTESSPSTHRNPPFGVRKIGSIGIPLPSTDCKIIDENGEEVATNEVGELIIKGPQVMKGYLNNEKETKNALKNGWLYTADLAKQDEDGYFYIVGRKKEMVITNGFNVYPQEIENVIYEHSEVKEVAVVGIPDQKRGEIVKAFIVPNENSTLSIEEIEGHCYKGLTPYKVPKKFEFIERLPRNNVGKVLKDKLIEEEIKEC